MTFNTESMKRYYSLLLFASVLAFASCDDDEKSSSSSSYKFKDQDLQGKINNESFLYDDGFADVGDEYIDITLVLPQNEDVCDLFNIEGNSVFFYVSNEIKLTKLSFDLSSWEGQTVTLFAKDGAKNLIATEGAIEILSITDTEVTGRIDARVDSKSYVNGNFTARRCPK